MQILLSRILMKNYYAMLLCVLSIGYSSGQNNRFILANEQSLADVSVKAVLKESILTGYEGMKYAAVSFIMGYSVMNLLLSEKDFTYPYLVQGAVSKTRWNIATLAGVLALVSYYLHVLRVADRYLDLSETAFDDAVEKYAKALVAKDTTVHPEDAYQKAQAYVTQKVHSAPARSWGACCSFAVIAAVGYYYKIWHCLEF